MSRLRIAPRRLLLPLSAAIAGWLACAPILAQTEGRAVLAGTVTDPVGSPVAGAEVTASSSAAGAPAARAISDDAGRFRLAFLIPSDDYLLKVEARGYSGVVAAPIPLAPGSTTIRDVTLSPATGDTPPTAEDAGGSMVDVASTKTATVYRHKLFDGLPLLGRRYQDVLTLAPGVNDVDSDGAPNVNGARESAFQTRLDGFDITDPLTGTTAQSINLDAIAETEVLAAGFPAVFGGAQGGYGNVLTRSGSNGLDGSLKLFYGSDLFDHDGANNNDFTGRDRLENLEGYDQLRGFFSIGGAMVRDRAWYQVSLEYENATIPVATLDGTIQSQETGWNNFVKLTFQPAAAHRVSASWLWDPRRIDGLGRGVSLDQSQQLLAGIGLTYGIFAESGFSAEQGGYSLSATWSYNLSPDLFLSTTVGHLDREIDVTPATDPGSCPLDGQGVCNPFLEDLYTADVVSGLISGPYFETSHDRRDRTSLRSEVTFLVDGGGTHAVVGGIELARSGFQQSVEQRTIRFDAVAPGPTGPVGQVGFLTAFPGAEDRSAEGRDIGLYLQDSYQPLPNVAINVGLRYDREESEMDGWTFLDPAASAAEVVRLFEIGNDLPPGSVDIRDVARSGYDVRFDVNGDGRDSAHCRPYDLDGSTFGDGMPDGGIDDFCTFIDGNFDGVVDPDDPFDVLLGPCVDPAAPPAPDGLADGTAFSPQCDRQSEDLWALIDPFGRHQLDATGDPFASLVTLQPDRDGDGTPAVCPAVFNPSFPDHVPGVDCTRGELLDPDDMPGATRAEDRVEVVNDNLAPRLGVSWDPWSDSRTKFFVTWGRYYDRLPLAALIPEQGPDERFTVYDAASIPLGSLATPLSTGRFSIWQADRALDTPFTDEWTAGIERELAPEWVVGLTYIHRSGRDQLQDVEVNHFTADDDGDGALDDNFGQFRSLGGGTQPVPDGLPDLFVYDPMLDRVFIIGNFNASTYESIQLAFTRRLGRRWQMQASYAYSEARSDGDEMFSPLGNDPAAAAEFGFTREDQTHVVKWNGVTYLPAAQQFGWQVHWASGAPFSVLTVRTSCDSAGNCALRPSFDTGERNDQRSEGAWDIDLRYRKDFHFGRYAAALSIEVDNLLNDDDLRITSFQPGVPAGVTGVRDFGRRWQLGVEFHF